MALHVLSPLAMTEQLLPALRDRDARVILVTSGGMYTQPLRDDDPEYLSGDYSGTTAYARSKRAQVELLPTLVGRWGPHGVRVYATHPGWADTPGVAESLPTFHRLTGPFLRDAEGGADTTIWLAADRAGRPPPAACGTTGAPGRPTSPRRTRPTDDQVERMWAWVEDQAGLEHFGSIRPP